MAFPRYFDSNVFLMSVAVAMVGCERSERAVSATPAGPSSVEALTDSVHSKLEAPSRVDEVVAEKNEAEATDAIVRSAKHPELMMTDLEWNRTSADSIGETSLFKDPSWTLKVDDPFATKDVYSSGSSSR